MRALAERAGYNLAMATEPHVTLSGDIVGDYIVKRKGPAGELTLVPDTYPTVVPEFSGRRMTPAEFDRFMAEHVRADDGRRISASSLARVH